MIKRIKCKIANNKTLGDMPIGSVVKIPENGVSTNYIVIQKGKPSDLYDDSCDGVWLLREKVHSKGGWHGTSNSTSANDYENSAIETWLNNDFLNTIDSKIRAAIKTVKIPYKKGLGNASTGVCSGANGLSCKVFLLSGYEVGFTTSDNSYLTIDGAKLSYFSDNVSRVGKDSTDTAAHWWLRSPYTNYAALVFGANTSGSLYRYISYYASVSVRPAFILPPNLSVEDDDTIVVTSSTQSSKQHANIQRGDTFKYCGYEWIILEHRDDNSTLVLSKNTIGNMPFDKNNSNNWGKSTLREYLNNEFFEEMCMGMCPSFLGFMPFTTDLTADDGLKDYGQSIDTVSLLTCDLYRKHRDIIEPIDEWWWLATPYSALAAYSCYVCNIYTDGTLDHNSAYNGYGGVRPVCCLKTDIIVDLDRVNMTERK